MKRYFRMAFLTGAAIGGFALQLTSQTPSAVSTSQKDLSPKSTFNAPLTLPAHVDLAALEMPATEPGAPATDPGAAAPATDGAAPATNPAAGKPANVTVPLRNEAVVKELAEMKKQFAQMAVMEAEMKAKMKKLESELDPDAGSADAERDADALRAAEGSDGSYAQAAPATTPAPAAAPAAPATPELNAQVTTKGEPFPGDWTWSNNAGHQTDSPMATKYFTPEFRSDANYTIDYNHPEDDTLGGSTETFRSDEWQLEQISVGGDIRINNVRGRFLCLCGGLWSVTTTRNDPSVVRGSWDLSAAYKYVAEGWGGYHWDYAHGLNLDAGIFVSYIGLFSYYNFDNWTYQPSFVSSNTPWFFNGIRLQYFPTAKLKIEPWFINGWQTYARPNGKPGLGGQVLWRPSGWFEMVSNNYGLGEDDTLEQQSQLYGGTGATRSRVHTDNSIEVKYYDKPKQFMDKMAFTLTGDIGCEYGGGALRLDLSGQWRFTGDGFCRYLLRRRELPHQQERQAQAVFCRLDGLPALLVQEGLFAVTLGGGQMTNPGRYLTLLPPINAATAVTGSPYFTENPGDRVQQHDGTITLDYMPSQFITFLLETGYRYSDIPYWTGRGGITPPGGDNGNPSDYQCAAGGDSGFGYGALTQAEVACGGNSTAAIWWPDLRTNQTVSTLAIMIRF